MSFSVPAKWRISILTSKDVFPERSARFLSSASTCWKRFSSRNGVEFNFETCSKGGFEFFRILATVGSIFVKQLTLGLMTGYAVSNCSSIYDLVCNTAGAAITKNTESNLQDLTVLVYQKKSAGRKGHSEAFSWP